MLIPWTSSLVASSDPLTVDIAEDGTWSGTIALVNEWSADNRMLGLSEDAEIDVRPLPLPVTVQYVTGPGHDGATVGLMTLDEVQRYGSRVMGRGRIDIEDPEGAALARKIRGGFFRFVSADIDKADGRLVCVGDDGQPVEDCDPAEEGTATGELYTRWRIMGASLLAHPAFPEAQIGMDPDTGRADEVTADDANVSAPTGVVASALAVDTELAWAPRDREWDGDAARQRVADWATAEGAESFDPDQMARAFLVVDTPPENITSYRFGVGDVIDGELTLVWRGVTAARAALAGARSEPDLTDDQRDQAEDQLEELYEAAARAFDDPSITGAEEGSAEGEPSAEMATDAPEPQQALAASAFAHPGFCPPTDYFRDPRLTEPTKVVVTEDRRIFGHLALWGVPHVSYQGTKIYAPKSPTAYERFHARPIHTTEGLVEVGVLAMGTDHASHRINSARAVDHYESTGAIVGAVRCGEDRFGVWVAGALLNDISDDERLRLSLADYSGDWRDEGAGLDLKAALAVPAGHEGFYTPKSRPANPEEYALVASGGVTAEHVEMARARHLDSAPDGDVGDVASTVDVAALTDAVTAEQDRRAQVRARFGAAAATLRAVRVKLASHRVRSPRVTSLAAAADEGDTDDAFDNNLEDYWKRGEGAAKIRWGTPGDWTRCHRHLTKHVGDERASRICSQWHHDTTGKWPGEKP